MRNRLTQKGYMEAVSIWIREKKKFLNHDDMARVLIEHNIIDKEYNFIEGVKFFGVDFHSKKYTDQIVPNENEDYQ